MRMLKLALPMLCLIACGATPLSATDSTISAVLDNGTRLYLSDGSVFVIDGHGVNSNISVGETASYEEGTGECRGKSVWNLTTLNLTFCVHRSKQKLVSLEVVQTETAKEIVTRSSAFAFPAQRIPISRSTSVIEPSLGGGVSVATEITAVVGEDIVLNGQNVRVRCRRCHALNPGEYQARLEGDKLWIVSLGMEWDKSAEKLTQRTYEEQWSIAGPWQ